MQTDSATLPAPVPAREGSLLAVLRFPNYRLLWAGQTISFLGDQFYLIALPWLVLLLTGNGFAVGTVLAVAAVPRALLMLVGGALSDRFTPRTLMLGSHLLRTAVVGLLAAMVFSGHIELWMLYFFALLFGAVDAFYYPAQSSIVAQILDSAHLRAGNALLQGSMQVSLFVGPVLAGAMVAMGAAGAPSGKATAPDLSGTALAFAIDAAGFLVSAATLWFIRAPVATGLHEAGIVSAIREGLVAAWHDAALRTFFLLVAAINFLVNGPIIVGIPLLAAARLPEGAAAYGIIMSCYGGGSLIGTVLAGTLPKPPPRWFGSTLLVVMSTFGFGVAFLGTVSSTAVAALDAGAMGVANGYVVIMCITWLQRRTPPAMLGRVMSLLMFAVVGLNPVSMAVAGALVDLDATAFFLLSGSVMAAIVLLSALSPTVRAIGSEEASQLAA